MMKFFRKYNKALLAVFMVLLMVVFLGGSALDTLLSPSGDRVVATSAVGTISFVDQRMAEDTRSILLAVAGVDAAGPGGAQVGTPGLVTGADRRRERLALTIRALQATKVGAVAGTGAGDKESHLGVLRPSDAGAQRDQQDHKQQDTGVLHGKPPSVGTRRRRGRDRNLPSAACSGQPRPLAGCRERARHTFTTTC